MPTGGPNGWRPELDVETVLHTVLANMLYCESAQVSTLSGPGGVSGPLRVDLDLRYHWRCASPVQEYSLAEAMDAFDRMVRNHGWSVAAPAPAPAPAAPAAVTAIITAGPSGVAASGRAAAGTSAPAVSAAAPAMASHSASTAAAGAAGAATAVTATAAMAAATAAIKPAVKTSKSECEVIVISDSEDENENENEDEREGGSRRPAKRPAINGNITASLAGSAAGGSRSAAPTAQQASKAMSQQTPAASLPAAPTTTALVSTDSGVTIRDSKIARSAAEEGLMLAGAPAAQQGPVTVVTNTLLLAAVAVPVTDGAGAIAMAVDAAHQQDQDLTQDLGHVQATVVDIDGATDTNGHDSDLKAVSADDLAAEVARLRAELAKKELELRQATGAVPMDDEARDQQDQDQDQDLDLDLDQDQ